MVVINMSSFSTLRMEAFARELSYLPSQVSQWFLVCLIVSDLWLISHYALCLLEQSKAGQESKEGQNSYLKNALRLGVVTQTLNPRT